MSKPMTFGELMALLTYVAENHAPGVARQGGRLVKYVDPVIDMRSNRVVAINLRGFGWEKVLHCQNECRDLPESLLNRCVDFLRAAAAHEVR